MKPPAYLAKLSESLPRTIQEALKLVGTAEIKGEKDNPVIMGWRDELKAAKYKIEGYSSDEIPWCGLFAAIVVHRAGKPVVKDPLWARNWAKFGKPADTPSLGDILVFARGASGHVGFYVGEDSEAFHVLGGNQADSVNCTRVEKSRLLAARRPIYTTQPATVKPFRLQSTGALSKDEA